MTEQKNIIDEYQSLAEILDGGNAVYFPGKKIVGIKYEDNPDDGVYIMKSSNGYGITVMQKSELEEMVKNTKIANYLTARN